MVSSKVAWSYRIREPKSPAAGASDAVATRASRDKIQEGRSFTWSAFWFYGVAFWNDGKSSALGCRAETLENNPVSD